MSAQQQQQQERFVIVSRAQLDGVIRRGHSGGIRLKAAQALMRADRDVLEIEVRFVDDVSLLDAELEVVGSVRNGTTLLLTARRGR